MYTDFLKLAGDDGAPKSTGSAKRGRAAIMTITIAVMSFVNNITF
jgi:hypothetical protein